MGFKFRSTFPYQYPHKIAYDKRLALIGSCFTERIGERFKKANFLVDNSFFGTLFNPSSIFGLLSLALEDGAFYSDLICQKDNRFVHFLSHSTVDGNTPSEVMGALQKERVRLKGALEQSDFLFITLGSSYAYKHKESGVIVANCHKQKQSEFEKVLLPISTMMDEAKKALDLIFKTNNSIKVILTVSPVKHLRDGVIENKLSKSQLRVLCNEIQLAFKEVSYLPVLEWVEEDLRDYRFYERDLAHPNEMAEQYIWERVQEAILGEGLAETIGQVLNLKDKIQKQGLEKLKESDRDKLEELNKLLPIAIS